MKVDELIAVSLPFVMAVVTQTLNAGIPGYVARMLPTLTSENGRVTLDEDAKKQFVDVSVHIYVQLSFVFSLLLSTISSIALTITTQRPIVAVVGAAFLLMIFPLWLVRWQGLNAEQLSGAAGRTMRITGWAVIIVLWSVTVYARFTATP